MKIKRITMYALVAAIYTALSLVMGTFSFGSVQIRISEVLMILCIFSSDFIIPLTLGCFLTNVFGLMLGLNFLTLDVIFGTIATLVSTILMNKYKDIKYKEKPIISLLIPCIVNGIVIGSELTLYLYYAKGFIKYFFISFMCVFTGEFITIFIMGLLLYKPFSNLSAYINAIE